MLLFGYHKEFVFEERSFFEISQNKNPSKITRYMVVYIATHEYDIFKGTYYMIVGNYCMCWLIKI